MSRSRLAARRTLTSLGPLGPLPAGARMRFRSAANVLAILCFEYRRAVAAERRYETLRRTDALKRTRTGISGANITRRVFVDMYSDRLPER